MATEKTVSFRSNLKSNAHDLISAIGWNCGHTTDLIAGLVSRLAAYTEEGVRLTPSVFLCSSISELVKRAGAGEYLPLSPAGVPTSTAAARILKAAASLCSGYWHVYVERAANGETLQFGVFCGSSDPSALKVEQVVLGSPDLEFPVVRVAQSGLNKVQVRTNAGDLVEFGFNDDKDGIDLHDRDEVRRLAQIIASDVPEAKEEFSGLVERLLSDAILRSHGTLIAVVPHGSGIPNELNDVIKFNKPVDLHSRLVAHSNEGRTAVSVSHLQTAADLLEGLISSDGIIVFDTTGNVLGYRAFIVGDDGAVLSEGGARSRAFRAMKLLNSTVLRAGFFRSQDGRMELAVQGDANE